MKIKNCVISDGSIELVFEPIAVFSQPMFFGKGDFLHYEVALQVGGRSLKFEFNDLQEAESAFEECCYYMGAAFLQTDYNND